MRQEKDAKRMAIGVPLSAIRLGRAAESKMKQDAMKGKGAAADNSSSRVKFSKSSEVFKQLVMPPLLLHRHWHICTSLFPAHHLVLFCRLLTHARPPPASAKRKEMLRNQVREGRAVAGHTCPSSTPAPPPPSLPALTRCSECAVSLRV